MSIQYLEAGKQILQKGKWVYNARTGKYCLTKINLDMEYDCREKKVEIVTTRKIHFHSAIAEFLGYLRGYRSAADFRALGCKTWDANANMNEGWLKNPYRQGKDDMGRCYGVQARDWRNPENVPIDQLENVYKDLVNGIDNRREIITFYNPGELDRACLTPCAHTHTFSLLDGELSLTVYQRSTDWALGMCFNMVQFCWFLQVMAHITGHRPGKVYHKNVNAHLYEDQAEIFERDQLDRQPYPSPTLIINPEIKTLQDLETWVKPEDFELRDYEHHPFIVYPFSV